MQLASMYACIRMYTVWKYRKLVMSQSNLLFCLLSCSSVYTWLPLSPFLPPSWSHGHCRLVMPDVPHLLLAPWWTNMGCMFKISTILQWLVGRRSFGLLPPLSTPRRCRITLWILLWMCGTSWIYPLPRWRRVALIIRIMTGWGVWTWASPYQPWLDGFLALDSNHGTNLCII